MGAPVAIVPVASNGVSIAAMAVGHFWTTAEAIGSSDDELDRIYRNEVPSCRIDELNKATATALEKLSSAPSPSARWN